MQLTDDLLRDLCQSAEAESEALRWERSIRAVALLQLAKAARDLLELGRPQAERRAPEFTQRRSRGGRR